MGTPYLIGWNESAASVATLVISVGSHSGQGTATGDAIVVQAGNSGGTTVAGVTDSKGNTYRQVTSTTTDENQSMWVADKSNNSGGPAALISGTDTQTVTYVSANTNIKIAVSGGVTGYSGTDVVPAPAVSASSTPASIASGTLAQASEVIWFGFQNGTGGGTPSVSGCTALATGSGGSAQLVTLAAAVATSTASVTGSASLAAAAKWSALCFSLKAVTAAVTGSGGVEGGTAGVAGAGTVSPPSVTGTGGVTGGAGRPAGTGTAVPPGVSGSGSVKAGTAGLAGTGAATPPAGVSGAGGVTGGTPGMAGTGAAAPPAAVTGSGGVAGGTPGIAGTVTVTAPAGVVGTGGVTGGTPGMAGTATATTPAGLAGSGTVMAVTVEPFSLTTGTRSKPLNWSTIQLVPAFNVTGSWTMTAAATPDVQALAVFDADGTLVPFGVVIDWNGVFTFTGKAEECEATRAIGDNGQVTETLTFTGPDMLSVLAERIAYPDPAKAWAAQAVGTVTKTGKAETVIKALITANCVSAGETARNYPLLDVAPDQARGGPVSWSITTPDPTNDAVVSTVTDSLMDIWRAIAAQSTTPIGVTVDWAGGRLVADCYEPRDLSSHAVFSARLGNLSQATLDVINPAANAILMQSDVTGAKFTETIGAGAGPWRRVEQFADQSSSTAAADVTQAQADAVTSGEAQTTLAATAIDLPRLRFGADAGGAGTPGGDDDDSGGGGTAFPVFGTDEQAPPSAVAAALGAPSLAAWRAYVPGSSGVPASYPGGAAGTIPPGTTMPVVSLKPALPLSSADQAALAAYFAQVPAGSLTTLWHEGEKSGFTPAQIKAAHATAHTIFKASAPAGARYGQIFETFTAFSGSSHFPLSQWVATQASGAPLDFYGFDLYPFSSTSGAAAAGDQALASLKTVIPDPVIGVMETNPTTGTGGITWTGAEQQWMTDSWAWAVTNGAICWLPYFDNAVGCDWPPDAGTIAELAQIRNLSVLGPSGAGSTADPYVAGADTKPGAASFVLALEHDIAAGDAVLVVASGSSTLQTVTGVTDSRGQAYVLAEAETASPDLAQYLLQGSEAMTAGTDTITVTFGLASGQNNVIAVGIPGLATSAIDKTAAANAASGTTPTVTTAALAQADEIAIAAISDGQGGGNPAWAAGWTALQFVQASGLPWTSVAWQRTTAPTAVTADATIVSAKWSITATTLKVAAPADAGGGTPPPATPGITGYRVGDLVSVDLYDGLTYSDIVSQVTLSADATQSPYTQTVVPSIGTTTDDTTISAALQQQLDVLEQKIRRA